LGIVDVRRGDVKSKKSEFTNLLTRREYTLNENGIRCRVTVDEDTNKSGAYA